MNMVLVISAFLLAVTVIYLMLDYRGARSIHLKKVMKFGIECLNAKDLIVQEYDNSGNLWATRGLLIYLLKKGDDKFFRVGRIPCGFNIYWLNNFKLVRRITLRSECIELSVNQSGNICAFSCGMMWFSYGIGQSFRMTMKLENFGLNKGRGIMSTGLQWVNENEVLFGEYFNNPRRGEVAIFKFSKENLTWSKLYEFPSGQIRHIHSVQKDSYTGRLWVCVGDEDNEAMIGWLDDNCENVYPIGSGSQIWRACQLVFSEDAMFWGTDTGSMDLAGIYRWDKITENLTLLKKTDGAIFFGTRLRNDIIVMSTDREGFQNERDEITRIYFLHKDGKITEHQCGTWNYKKHGFRFNFAKLRLQRSQGDDYLAISVLNQKEMSDAELLLIHEEIIADLL
ncbi:MAG: hypothetical protein IH594_06210 [Bacteroidales bacterium]|nr:hypothetical protein [Bacteroidales bacterium]